MKQNVGTIDRLLRFALAALIAILFFSHIISGVVAIVLMVFAGIFILTGLVNFCPIYAALGISTKENKNENENNSN